MWARNWSSGYQAQQVDLTYDQAHANQTIITPPLPPFPPKHAIGQSAPCAHLLAFITALLALPRHDRATCVLGEGGGRSGWETGVGERDERERHTRQREESIRVEPDGGAGERVQPDRAQG